MLSSSAQAQRAEQQASPRPAPAQRPLSAGRSSTGGPPPASAAAVRGRSPSGGSAPLPVASRGRELQGRPAASPSAAAPAVQLWPPASPAAVEQQVAAGSPASPRGDYSDYPLMAVLTLTEDAPPQLPQPFEQRFSAAPAAGELASDDVGGLFATANGNGSYSQASPAPSLGSDAWHVSAGHQGFADAAPAAGLTSGASCLWTPLPQRFAPEPRRGASAGAQLPPEVPLARPGTGGGGPGSAPAWTPAGRGGGGPGVEDPLSVSIAAAAAAAAASTPTRPRRPLSAGAGSTASSARRRHQGQALDVSLRSSGAKTPDTQVVSRLYRDAAERTQRQRERIEQRQVSKIQDELKGSTFSPAIDRTQRWCPGVGKALQDYDGKNSKQRLQLLRLQKERQELVDCTFQPKVDFHSEAIMNERLAETEAGGAYSALYEDALRRQQKQQEYLAMAASASHRGP